MGSFLETFGAKVIKTAVYGAAGTLISLAVSMVSQIPANYQFIVPVVLGAIAVLETLEQRLGKQIGATTTPAASTTPAS